MWLVILISYEKYNSFSLFTILNISPFTSLNFSTHSFFEVSNLQSKHFFLFLLIFLSLVYSTPIRPALSYSDANCAIEIFADLHNFTIYVSSPIINVVNSSSNSTTYNTIEISNSSTIPTYPVPSFSLTTTTTSAMTSSTPTYPYSFYTGWDNFTYEMFLDEINYYSSINPSFNPENLTGLQVTFTNTTFFISTILKNDLVLPSFVLYVGRDSFVVKANESLTFSYFKLLNTPVFLHVTLNYNFNSKIFPKLTPIEFLIDLTLILLPFVVIFLFLRLKRKYYPHLSIKKEILHFSASLKVLFFRQVFHKKDRNSLENIISLVEDILEESISNGGKTK